MTTTSDSGSANPAAITISFDALLQARLTAIAPWLAQSSVFQELGVTPSPEVICRVAIVRGIARLEELQSAGLDPWASPAASATSAAAPAGSPQPAAPSRKGRQPPEAPELAAIRKRDPYMVMHPTEPGRLAPLPEGMAVIWEPVADRDDVPDEQLPLHDYYVANGWTRYLVFMKDKEGGAGEALDFVLYTTDSRDGSTLRPFDAEVTLDFLERKLGEGCYRVLHQVPNDYRPAEDL